MNRKYCGKNKDNCQFENKHGTRFPTQFLYISYLAIDKHFRIDIQKHILNCGLIMKIVILFVGLLVFFTLADKILEFQVLGLIG